MEEVMKGRIEGLMAKLAAKALGASEEEIDMAIEAVSKGVSTGQRLCIVCASGPLEVVYVGCRHVCLCQECSRKNTNGVLDNCPMCRLASARVCLRLCGL